jgi:hypothetical protein
MTEAALFRPVIQDTSVDANAYKMISSLPPMPVSLLGGYTPEQLRAYAVDAVTNEMDAMTPKLLRAIENAVVQGFELQKAVAIDLTTRYSTMEDLAEAIRASNLGE